PRVAHFENPNPSIRLDEWNLRIPAETTPLKQSGQLVVGVNSFGFGGANAHVILRSPEVTDCGERVAAPDSLLPLVVTGKTEGALKSAARELAVFLRNQPEIPWYDVAWTAAFRRDWHEHRAVVLAGSRETAALELERFADSAGGSTAVESGMALPPPAEVAF